MTNDTPRNIDIDAAQLRSYISEYREADSRAEQRSIENQVLAATVWKTPTDQQEGTLTLEAHQVEHIYAQLPDDAHKARRILRSYYVNEL
jgi:hypothetical protein